MSHLAHYSMSHPKDRVPWLVSMHPSGSGTRDKGVTGNKREVREDMYIGKDKRKEKEIHALDHNKTGL